jgi:hypothetical protein
MVKSKHIFLYILIFFIFGIFIVMYRAKKINDSYPYFVKEFLDNPTPETEKKLCDEACSLAPVNASIDAITSRLNAIEKLNTQHDKEINENTITSKNAADEISALQAELKKAELELAEELHGK